MGDGWQRRRMANRGIISEVCIQLYPCGRRCSVRTFLPGINTGVISHTLWPVIAGWWEVVPHSQSEVGFFTVTGRRLGRPFTLTLESECPVWFKAVYMAHFLHNEQQMLTEGISLLTPPKLSVVHHYAPLLLPSICICAAKC